MQEINNLTLQFSIINFGKIWRKNIDFSCHKENLILLNGCKLLFTVRKLLPSQRIDNISQNRYFFYWNMEFSVW
jgi:hypothetical protein